MIRALTLTLCLGIVFGIHAQDFDKAAQLTCDCLENKDISTIDIKMAQAEMGLCLIQAAKEVGIELDLTDNEAMKQLGMSVGIKMAGICLETLLKFTNADKKSKESEVLEEVSGTVKSVESGDFVYVVVEEESGRESKFLWLRYFTGSDEYIDKPKKLTGKKVVVAYREIECYVPKAGGYYKQKEIAAIKFQ